MATYSNSKLSSFENCPLKYKYSYIDRIKPDIDTGVEAFMGSRVHETLEEVYRKARLSKIMSFRQVIIYYRKLWRQNWNPKVLIVRKEFTQRNYRQTGERFLKDYYTRFHPFNEIKVLGVETQDMLTLPDGNKYHVRIDKLGCVGSVYYVCDYKTDSRMKDQSTADADRQLAMYAIWVKNKFSDVSKVVLKWHMLAFDKDVESVRTDKQLKELEKDVMKQIKKLESCTSFKPNQSRLCDWCGYRAICPLFKHLYKVKDLEPESFKKEDGVRLVNELARLEERRKDTVCKIETVKERLITYAKQLGVSIVFGSDMQAKISIKASLKVPAKGSKERVFLEDLIKEYNKWMDVSCLDSFAIKKVITSGKWDAKLLDKVGKLIKEEETTTVSLSRLKKED